MATDVTRQVYFQKAGQNTNAKVLDDAKSSLPSADA